uniref:Uncharacterized protein n=1 Tax=Caenorhabditis tropicalis TaxID=1561998 RepID=A0A1I7UJ93_9PELO
MSTPSRMEMERNGYEEHEESEIDIEISNLSPFFQRMLPEGPSTSRRTSTERRIPARPPSMIERERNEYLRQIMRREASTTPIPNPVMRTVISPGYTRRKPQIETLFPMDPLSPTESEEKTPPNSRNHSPSPPRSPIHLPEEQVPIPPPNSPESGIPLTWERRAEDNINMGLGWALSWIDTIKPSRFEAEERISLPRIFDRIPRRTLICLVAHISFDETIFQKIEVPMKTERKVRKALAKFFHLPIPFHRLRLKVDEFAEVAINQRIINRFEPVEYFRLDTRIKNKWILHQIVNCPRQPRPFCFAPPNFEVAKRGRTEFF